MSTRGTNGDAAALRAVTARVAWLHGDGPWAAAAEWGESSGAALYPRRS